jgi:hypothetical protein
MRRTLLALSVLLAVLLGAASPAAAKGPTEATITGPGIDEPIDIRADLSDTTFWSITEDLGYYAVVGAGGNRAVERPTGDLGPAYRLHWSGPSSVVTDFDLTVVLHPWAEGGGRIFVPARQQPIVGGPTEATWYPMPLRVLPTLERAGFPDRATAFAAIEPPAETLRAEPVVASSGGDGVPAALPVALVAVVLGGLAWVLHRLLRPTVTPV